MSLSVEEIESLKEQLKQKTEEIRAIYDKLAEAGVTEIADNCLEAVNGGYIGPNPSGWVSSLKSNDEKGGIYVYPVRQ